MDPTIGGSHDFWASVVRGSHDSCVSLWKKAAIHWQESICVQISLGCNSGMNPGVIPIPIPLFLVLFPFQGDVFRTRGGGQAVQFTDVETLKQESPTG